jgi:dihydroorotase
VLTDESLQGFDTRFKVLPPLRTEADRTALIEGVIDGTIDLITSDHNPLDIENKMMEFALAKNGTIGLESAFGALLTVLPLEIVIQKLTAGRKIFNLDESDIKEGSVADITLFTPESNYTFTKEHILSKSKNSAFLGREMQGKVYGIINNGKFVVSNN